MKHLITVIAMVLTIAWTIPALAQHQHHGGMSMPAPEEGAKPESKVGNESSPNRTFLLEGGIKAAFSIMTMADHKKMLKDMNMKADVDPQATHNIAVTLTDTRTNMPLTDAVVKMKVIDSKGKEQIKLLDFMKGMNQYGGDFALAGKGRYQVLILFKWADKKYPAGFYYVLK